MHHIGIDNLYESFKKDIWSALGPGGIPSAVWARCAVYITRCLHRRTEEVMVSGFVDPRTNCALTAYIRKTDKDLLRADETRPLVLKDASDKRYGVSSLGTSTKDSAAGPSRSSAVLSLGALQERAFSPLTALLAVWPPAVVVAAYVSWASPQCSRPWTDAGLN